MVSCLEQFLCIKDCGVLYAAGSNCDMAFIIIHIKDKTDFSTSSKYIISIPEGPGEQSAILQRKAIRSRVT